MKVSIGTAAVVLGMVVGTVPAQDGTGVPGTPGAPGSSAAGGIARDKADIRKDRQDIAHLPAHVVCRPRWLEAMS